MKQLETIALRHDGNNKNNNSDNNVDDNKKLKGQVSSRSRDFVIIWYKIFYFVFDCYSKKGQKNK